MNSQIVDWIMMATPSARARITGMTVLAMAFGIIIQMMGMECVTIQGAILMEPSPQTNVNLSKMVMDNMMGLKVLQILMEMVNGMTEHVM